MSGLGTRSLFVVGDDAQSIYAFRGSKIEIILDFAKIYNNTKEIVLNQNYRSVQSILDLAEKVISHNHFQKKKNLFTTRTDQISVNYFLAKNEKEEAEFIIKELYETYVKNQPSPEEQDLHKLSEFFSQENIAKLMQK